MKGKPPMKPKEMGMKEKDMGMKGKHPMPEHHKEMGMKKGKH